jgi:glycosyltransferase involved in cell wall biosynthesis
MKIVFIVGALEPGRDGVGDYSRRLAGALSKNGDQVAIISINDKYITKTESGIQYAEDQKINVLRIASMLTSSERFSAAQKFIEAFSPEWISIQFVPYAFHPKGLPFGLVGYLRSLSNGRKIHFMFHELWVGLYGEVSFKNKIVGKLQKLIIRNLLSSLRPNFVTTTIPIYKQNLLNERKEILPLFSNIPVIVDFETFQKSTNDITVTAIHFGSFSGNLKEFRDQLIHLKSISEISKRKLNLVVMGEGGPFKLQALNIAYELLGREQVSDLGKLSFEDVSKNMLKADIGISRADYVMFGKSGSTIAMLEHGLPVILRGKRPVNSSYEKIEEFEDQLIFSSDEIKLLPRKRLPISQLEKVSLTLTKNFALQG